MLLCGQGGVREEDSSEPEGHGQQTPARVRRPTVRYSPSPPASTLVNLGRPKFQRRRGPGGQSQDFLNRMGKELTARSADLAVEEGPGEERQDAGIHGEFSDEEGQEVVEAQPEDEEAVQEEGEMDARATELQERSAGRRREEALH